MAEPAHLPPAHAGTEAPGSPAHHVQPSVAGLTAPMIVALAIVVVLVLLVWKRVPAAIGRSLDAKIATIRQQLAEAESLRKEAEALRQEYEGRSKAAEAEAAAMIERANHDAEAILAKANQDAEALIERRGRMAEDKIAAEERSVVTELRASAAGAASRAAARLIGERNDPQADARLVDQAIRGLANH